MQMISASKAKNFAWQMIEAEFPSLTRKTAINQGIISYFKYKSHTGTMAIQVVEFQVRGYKRQ